MARPLALLALAFLVTSSNTDVPHGGLPLTEIVLARLANDIDYRGQKGPLIFVFQSDIDVFVSASILKGGGWEPALNALYSTLIKEYQPPSLAVTIDGPDRSSRSIVQIGVDVGANLGAFALYAASRGRRVFAFAACNPPSTRAVPAPQWLLSNDCAECCSLERERQDSVVLAAAWQLRRHLCARRLSRRHLDDDEQAGRHVQ
jgi:hypothetical protein